MGQLRRKTRGYQTQNLLVALRGRTRTPLFAVRRGAEGMSQDYLFRPQFAFILDYITKPCYIASHPRSLRGVSGDILKAERGVASCGGRLCNRSPREARDPARQALRPGCEELAARSRRQLPAVVGRRAPKETEARPRGPKPPRWSAERRASRVMIRPTGAAAPERFSALRPPLDSGVSEARMQAPDAEMRRGNEMGCLTS